MPISRHPLDDLVHKVEGYKGNESKILIFGDSITHDTLKYYLIENEGSLVV